ncbi:MAG: hypothetical protein WBQ79_15675 [Acidobacteriaceae bacterium]
MAEITASEIDEEERIMNVRQILIYGVCGAALFAGGVAVGQQDINPRVHPHLAEAQKLISSAQGQIDQAQSAWKEKLGGHAQRAKDLLKQADGELRQAAEYANKYK